MSKSRIPSPSRSQGAPITPRRYRQRRAFSTTSPARSDASGRLTSVVEQFLNNDKFAISPMKRRSVLPDDTDIDVPRRASWWKRLDGSSRDVLEALDVNKMEQDMLLEDYEIDIEKERQSQSLPESSDNESIASIVVPQRKLLKQTKQPQGKFAEIVASRKSLGRTIIEDEDKTINNIPKNLLNRGELRNKPVFPAALLNSTNKTINKTVEPEAEPKRGGRNIFGQAGTKRKNMFTDLVMSESEDDSEIQHKVFGFKKNDNKRISLASRNRRMPSLTPSVTTEIDADDWNLLPSSTMIGNGSGSFDISRVPSERDIQEDAKDKTMEEEQDENQDLTLTDQSVMSKSKKRNISNRKSLNQTRFSKSRKQDDDTFDKTLTNEDIMTEQASVNHNAGKNTEFQVINKSQNNEKEVSKHQANKSLVTNASKCIEIKEAIVKDDLEPKQNDKVVVKQTIANESVEDQMAKLHEENENKSESESKNESAILNESENVDESGNKNESEDKDESENKDESGDEDESENKDESVDKDESDNREESENKDESEHKTDSEQEIETTAEQESQSSTKNVSNENEEVDMEEMVWDDNDDDKASKHDESQGNEAEQTDDNIQNKDKANVSERNEDQVSKHVTTNKDFSEKSRKMEIETVAESEKAVKPHSEVEEKDENNKNEITNHSSPTKDVLQKSKTTVLSFLKAPVDEDNEVVDETPNTSYDAVGRNRKKSETKIKSPEVVLQNMSEENISFKPIGRSTTFRKSAVENINARPTLMPVQESTVGSDRSTNSSTEGSGWDSHRTTRMTLRQTFGKDFTPRKSLRALVMEQSAKRQTQADKTANKTVSENANKTKNKTALGDFNKTKNKTGVEDANKTKNKTVEDVADHHIRDRRESHNIVNDVLLPNLGSSVLGTSTHHVPDPLISKPQTSYHKSVVDTDEPEISNHEMNNEVLEDMADHVGNDSGPEISILASYGEGMFTKSSTHERDSDASEKQNNMKMASKTENTFKDKLARIETDHEMAEVLDYDPSIQEGSTHDVSMSERSKLKASSKNMSNNQTSVNETRETSMQNHSAREVSIHSTQQDEEEDSKQEESNKEIETVVSEPEIEEEEEMEPESDEEMEQEESQQEMDQESDQEVEEETSVQDLEQESQEIEVLSEEEAQEESDLENEQEKSQDSEQESEQESDNEESEQQITSQNTVIEDTQEQSDQESDHDFSQNIENEIGSDDEQNDEVESDNDVTGGSQYSNSRTDRVVFDNEMSDQEIDYEVSERVSRQTSRHEVSEQVSARDSEQELSVSRDIDQTNCHDESIGTKRSLLLMQMQKIAQQNMDMRQKIREKVQNSLKPSRDVNKYMYPLQSKFSIRRMNKPEPKKPKNKPMKSNVVPIADLPQEFVNDLHYKPPKRFQPANAPWITKRLYKFLETKLEPKYDYRARVRAEELVQTIYSFAKLVRRRDLAPQNAVDELKKEMARLHVVKTHFEFYDFFHEFMPREIRVKVNPDVVNKIPLPRNGIFADILEPRTAVA